MASVETGPRNAMLVVLYKHLSGMYSFFLCHFQQTNGSNLLMLSLFQQIVHQPLLRQ